MTDGDSLPPDLKFPFNDFWYWGKALTDGGSREAICFLEWALERAETHGEGSQQERRQVETLLATARAFPVEGAQP